MTGEYVLLMLERAEERLRAEFEARFDQLVAATRIAFHADQKTYRQWAMARRSAKGKQKGLTGAALERRVLSLRATNPEYVVVA